MLRQKEDLLNLPNLNNDPIETYFECISSCDINDGKCISNCLEILKEDH